MPAKLDEEKQEELFDMLDQGMGPSAIAEELDISERAVYNYKDEWEEEQEIVKNVTKGSGTNEEAVLDAAGKVPGMGEKTRDALENALDMSPWALEDPNELYKLINQVTDLKHYWIDTLVKNAFPQLSSGGNQRENQNQRSPQYAMGAGGQGGPQGGQYPNYQTGHTPQGGAPQGTPQGGPYGGQGGTPQGPSPQGGGQPRDPRVDQLQDQVKQLTEAVTEMANQDDDDDDGVSGTIEIQQEDGSVLRMPADDPRAAKLLEEEEEDMFETLAKLKEAGLIMSPQDMMAMQESDDEDETIAEAMEKLGEMQMKAQQQMSQNFASAIESLQKREEEQEDLTLDDVEEVIEQKLTKDETERLREEMDEKFNKVLDKVNRRPAQPAEQDPEFLKADREIQFREKQLEALNNNLNTLPEKLAVSVRDGLVPAMKQLQSGANPFWSPPGQQGRGEPQYTPESVRGSREQRQQEQAARQEARQRQQRQTSQQRGRGEYPDRGGQEEQRQNQQQQANRQQRTDRQQSQMAQDEPQDTTAQDAEEIRDKLNLGDGGGRDGEAMS